MPAPTLPTGTVTFRRGSAVLGTGALNASGQATFSTSSLSSFGDNTITADYGGDTTFNPSSDSVVQVVKRFRSLVAAVT